MARTDPVETPDWDRYRWLDMFEQVRERQIRLNSHPFGGGVISLALHAACGVGVLLVLNTAPAAPSVATRSAPTFITLSLQPPVRYEVVPARPEKRQAVRLKELVRPIAQPDITSRLTPERKPEEVRPPTPVPERPSRMEPAAPPPPRVSVGTFANGAAPSITPPTTRQVDAAGFDAPVVKARDEKPASTLIAGFDNASAAPVKPDAARPAGSLVADTGFGTATTAATPKPSGDRLVRGTGFGDAGAAPVRPEPPKPAGVQQSGFAAAPTPAPAPKVAAAVRSIDTPLEVLSKPAPPYTDEARALKIEGEVLLDVEFCASGKVRVLGVTRGLGHGLDETAVRAAEQIQFKPARKDGQPVDFRATVHMTFRLT
jgi:TonB family protein